MAGIAAIVLTILGLAQVAPLFLVAIATIAVGIALAAHGANVAAQYSRLVAGRSEVSLAFAGAATGGSSFWRVWQASSLGILALLQIVPAVPVAIATIGFGAGATLGSAVGAQLAVLAATASGAGDPLRRMVIESASSSSAVQVLAGLSAIVLGDALVFGGGHVVLPLLQ